MNLKFIKNNDDIEIRIVNDKGEIGFSYVDYITLLYKKEKFDKPEFDKNMVDDEIEPIKKMLKDIDQHVSNYETVEGAE